MEKPVLFDYFEKTANILMNQFDRSSLQKSSYDLGRNREHFFYSFLKKVLPKKMSFGSGEIWDSARNKTGQQDLILLKENAPLLHIGSENIYLVEGVFAVIEIKSNLTKGELEKTAKKFQEIKNLKPRIKASIRFGKPLKKPLTLLFAYKGATLKNLKDEILKNQWQDAFDLISILDRGAIIKKGLCVTWPSQELFGFARGKAAALAYLYQHIVFLNSGVIANSIDLNGYFQPMNSWDIDEKKN